MKNKIFLYALMVVILSCSKGSDDSSVYQEVTQNQTTSPPATTPTNTNTSGSSSTTPDPTFDRSAMLVFWADQIIIPAQKKFKEDLESLDNSIENFVSSVMKITLKLLKIIG